MVPRLGCEVGDLEAWRRCPSCTFSGELLLCSGSGKAGCTFAGFFLFATRVFVFLLLFTPDFCTIWSATLKGMRATLLLGLGTQRKRVFKQTETEQTLLASEKKGKERAVLFGFLLLSLPDLLFSLLFLSCFRCFVWLLAEAAAY